MGIILEWLKRIPLIGILDFLRGLGWRVWPGLVMVIAALAGLVVVLTLILIAILL